MSDQILNNNFDMEQKVTIHSTNSVLDGETGIIKGQYNSVFYIVLFDNKVEGYNPAIVLIQHCLK